MEAVGLYNAIRGNDFQFSLSSTNSSWFAFSLTLINSIQITSGTQSKSKPIFCVTDLCTHCTLYFWNKRKKRMQFRKKRRNKRQRSFMQSARRRETLEPWWDLQERH